MNKTAVVYSKHKRSPPDNLCSFQSCNQVKEGVLNVHIVPHTHDDVGWLKTVDQYYYGSRNNIQKAGVQYILDSVVKELWEDPKRRFIYVETAFFWKWWNKQNDATQQKVKTLVKEGRLQFIGGAWSMNDEATTHYQSTIDQFTWGLRKLKDTFGQCGIPTVGWQIDPFGHSREFASLLAGMGFQGLFLGRIDYQDKGARLRDRRMEMLWRGDDDLGEKSDIFTGVLYNTYSPPPGFCFDVLCGDEPVVDDVASPAHNVDRRVSALLQYINAEASHYRSGHIVLTMGGDFTYQDAGMWYTNLDKLIEHTNRVAEGKVHLFYSTPNCYLKAVHDANPTLPTKRDDFFPYASDPNSFWTGYFTSKPTIKLYEREGNNVLQMVKQLQVLAQLDSKNMDAIDELKSTMGVMQHHDAVTGTEKAHVAHDYERMLSAAVAGAVEVTAEAVNKLMSNNGTVDFKWHRCMLNESSCHVSEHSQRFMVSIYNPLAWKLDAIPVRIPVTEQKYRVTAPNGDYIETQLVPIPKEVIEIPTRKSTATHELVFVAIKVKPLGYKNFFVEVEPNTVKREKRSVNRETKDDKRKMDFYESVNDYWKNVREQSFVNIETIDAMDKKDVERPVKLNQDTGFDDEDEKEAKFENTEKVFVNTDNDKYLDPTLDILKDNKEDEANVNIAELQKLIKESRIVKQMKHKPAVKPVVNLPPLSEDEMRMLSDDPMIVQVYPEAEEVVMRDQASNASFNVENPAIYIPHPSGGFMSVSFDMAFYRAAIGDNRAPSRRSSGAYIFRPNVTKPFIYDKKCTSISGSIVNELRCVFTEYVSLSVRSYVHPLLVNWVEIDWVIGSIPIEDNIGKEIVAMYNSNMINNGEFYTDSNGRQMLKRKLNYRPQWNLTLDEPIAGNYYPVTNKISIEDDKYRFSVLTDRSEGGASLTEGQIELMLHRRLLEDDAFGVNEALNETANDQGLNVRGNHWLVLSDLKNKDSLIYERKKLLEHHLRPQMIFADTQISKEDYLKLKNCHGGVKYSLPIGLHLLTLEPWNDKQVLIRLENYLEKSDGKESIQFDIKKLFENVSLTAVKEVMLAANQNVGKERMRWNIETPFEDEERSESRETTGFEVILQAKEIKTFIVVIE
ncbi:lysosomal alpha-mannosidase [Plutella xylostella]|uniref:lysosomal alpha-mannosidase n=1 Tax=Plutella xylostella TaxID=51655 RepID=UPI002032ABEF|nr:lysosomal alpha-mannosidase [Plutella xylostella]